MHGINNRQSLPPHRYEIVSRGLALYLSFSPQQQQAESDDESAKGNEDPQIGTLQQVRMPGLLLNWCCPDPYYLIS